MLRIRRVSEVIGLRVFTDTGDYFGEVEEANLLENKIDSWRIRLSRDSGLASYLGGARGLIVPHQFIKSMGDVIIVSRAAVPSKDSMDEEPETSESEVM
jgi:sporulation protein YlmC with PRC-barrel domain